MQFGVFQYRRFVHRAARRETKRNKLDTAKHERSWVVNVVVVPTRICIHEGKSQVYIKRRCMIGGNGSIGSGASIRAQNSDSVVSDVRISTQRSFSFAALFIYLFFRRGVDEVLRTGCDHLLFFLVEKFEVAVSDYARTPAQKTEKRARRDE